MWGLGRADVLFGAEPMSLSMSSAVTAVYSLSNGVVLYSHRSVAAVDTMGALTKNNITPMFPQTPPKLSNAFTMGICLSNR